jgi:hypothetical protein
MLRFAAPPPLAPVADGIPDHADPQRLHVLPAGVAIAEDGQGDPCFTLSRFRDEASGAAGGILHVELALTAIPATLLGAAAADGWSLRQVGFDATRVQLRGWGGGLEDEGPLGAWSSAIGRADRLIAATCRLDQRAVQLLEAWLTAEASVAEIEVEGLYHGLAGITLPILASAKLDDVDALLRRAAPGLFTAAGAPLDAVEAALLSGLTLQLDSLGETAPPVTNAELMPLLVLALRDDLLVPVPDADPWAPRFMRRDDVPDTGLRSWDMSIARRANAIWRTRWSVRGFYEGIDVAARRALFPAFSRVAPFSSVAIAVLAHDRIDPRFVRRVQLDVTHSGSGGVPRERSVIYPPIVPIHRFFATYPALTSRFALSATIAATLGGGEGTLPNPLPARPLLSEGTSLFWSLADAGVASMAVTARDSLFDRAARIEIVVSNGADTLCRAVLTRLAPEALPAWPAGDDAAVRITAFRDMTADTPAVVLHEGPASGQITLDDTLLEVIDPDMVEVSLDPNSGSHLAFAAVTLADPTGRDRTMTLDLGRATRWPCWRQSRFDPIAYRYRVQHVPRLPDGGTGPLVTGEWQDGSQTALKIAPIAVPAVAAPANRVPV